MKAITSLKIPLRQLTKQLALFEDGLR
jgi:hypothetical protein